MNDPGLLITAQWLRGTVPPRVLHTECSAKPRHWWANGTHEHLVAKLLCGTFLICLPDLNFENTSMNYDMFWRSSKFDQRKVPLAVAPVQFIMQESFTS